MPYMELVVLMPLVASAISFLFRRWGRLPALATMLISAITFAFVTLLCWNVYLNGPMERGIWYVDELSGIFVMLIAIVSFAVSIYSYGYVARDIGSGHMDADGEWQYYALLNLFVPIMLLTCMVSSFGLLWIAIEATTLVSAFLVGFYRRQDSTEAAWKYLMICSVGITMALVGIALVYAASIGVLIEEGSALDFPILYNISDSLNPDIMRVAFVFMFIGFGTKMGLVPMHTWLPDAHSQAPTPISALLSATLLNCALYGMIRLKMIIDIAVPDLSQGFFIGFGALSLILAALFIMRSRDIKRMFAYSSIEHMGIIMIGLGIGTQLAIFGALFHVIAHSILKSFTFLSVGNVVSEYGTRDMGEIRGLREGMPFSASMLTLGTLAMVGVPPFAIFTGEALIIYGALSAENYLVAVAMVIAMLMVFAGSLRNIAPMMSGEPPEDVHEVRGWTRKAPLVALLAIGLFLGLFMPDQLRGLIDILAMLIGGLT